MSLRINKNILWLEIPIYHSSVMHELHCQYQLCSSVFCPFFRETLCFSDMIEKVTSIYILHYEIEILFLKQIAIKFYNVRRALQLLHNLQLKSQVTYVFIFFFLSFKFIVKLKHFNCVYRILGNFLL